MDEGKFERYASDTARANKFERSARLRGLSVRTWIKFKALAKFKGCEISNTRGISDFRGILKRREILNIVEFKYLEILNAYKISRSRARAFKDGAVSQVFAGHQNCG